MEVSLVDRGSVQNHLDDSSPVTRVARPRIVELGYRIQALERRGLRRCTVPAWLNLPMGPGSLKDARASSLKRPAGSGTPIPMISQKMKYALKALMVLADEKADRGRALRIEEIAKQAGTPKRFLEQILLEIRNAGIVSSIRGRSGGYVLVRDPEAVQLSELLRLIDGPIAPLPCLSRRHYARCEDCTDEASCRIRRVFAEVFWSYLVLIDSLTLADLVRSPERVEQVFAV